MKILIKFILFSCFLTLSWGCSRETIPGIEDVGDGMFHVHLGMGIPAADATKSIVSGTETPVSSMQLLCFNELGYFIGSYPATVSNTGSSPDRGTITAKIPGETRRIHFIANKPITFSGSYIGWKETRLMTSDLLKTSYNDSGSGVVFWGYYRNDVAADMKAWLEGEGGTNTVYLLRDRAKVVLSEVTDNTVKSIEWTVSNGLASGYIVPTNNTNLATDPYSGYYTQVSSDYFGNTVAYPCTENGRYTAAESNLEAKENPQFLYEDENTLSSPIKLILKVTYNDDSVRFHTVLLMDSDYKQYIVTRSHTYNLVIAGLPKSMGYASFNDAVAGTQYSNNQLVSVSRIVTDVTNGEYSLNITETTGTSVIYHTSGSKQIGFTYTNKSGSGVSEMSSSDFSATWFEHDGSIAATTASVSYNSSNGVGAVSITMNEVTPYLQQGVLLLQDKKHGLARYIHVYSITQFTFASNPVLSLVSGSRHNDHDVYRLDFRLPMDYPTGLYPVKVSFTTSTLNAFSDVSASQTAAQSFGVEVASTSSLGSSTNPDDWFYKASSWGYWYTYSILAPSSDNAYTFYLEDIRSSRADPPTTVGLFLDVENFGAVRSVSP